MTTIPILSISGSDSTGQSGIQADIKTIAALGGYAVTAVSCISVQSGNGVRQMTDLPVALAMDQVRTIMSDAHPRAVKVGLVRDAEMIRQLRGEVIACPRLVVAPGIYSSDGSLMMGQEAIVALKRYLIPEAMLLMVRCRDAEKLLGMPITTDDSMLEAASRLHAMGAQWVLLRGGKHAKGRLTALLLGDGTHSFFSSYNTDGWQRHGIGGALSAAITTRLGLGDDVPTAIRNAHDYMHAQVVYAKEDSERALRPIDLYNSFIGEVAEHYVTAHDVAFYADRLNITTRYLSGITDKVAGKSPKQVIADYLLSQAKTYLSTTRLTVQEVSNKLGFSSQAMFCRFFKDQTGLSPNQHRKS